MGACGPSNDGRDSAIGGWNNRPHTLALLLAIEQRDSYLKQMFNDLKFETAWDREQGKQFAIESQDDALLAIIEGKVTT